MYMLLTLLAVSLLVVLHELGHLVVARAFGMRVLCFSIGFGPALWRHQRGGITWQVALLPIGGYVQIDGMGDDNTGETAASPAASQTDDGKFYNKPVWQRLLVIFAGPAANWLTSALLLMGLAATCGFSQVVETPARLGELPADGPAARAGLLPGDTVVAIEQQSIVSWSQLVETVRQKPAQTLHFTVQRPGSATPISHAVLTESDPQTQQGRIQALPQMQLIHYAPLPSIAAGWRAAWQLSVAQATLMRGMLTGKSSGRLTSLPGIVKIVSQQAALAWRHLFEQMANISIGLCLLNLLPIPALDGSRLTFLLLELIRRRPLSAQFEAWVHTAGFVLLFGVMLAVSLRDLWPASQ